MKLIDIVRKDIILILSDKKALGIMILMPIVLTTILSFALSDSFVSSNNDAKIKIAVVKKYDVNEEKNRFESIFNNDYISKFEDEDRGNRLFNALEDIDMDAIFTNEFLNHKDVKEILEYRIVDEEKAIDLLKSGEIDSVVIIPQNYIYDMNINFFTPLKKKINIDVIGHPNRPIKAQIIEEVIKNFSEKVSSIIISKNVFLDIIMEENLEKNIFEDIETIVDQVKVKSGDEGVNINYLKIKGRNPITSFAYYSIAMTTMFILFAGGYGSKSLLEEKENVTYQRMVMVGISKWSIVFGKFLTMFSLALIQIAVMTVYSNLTLKVDWGNPYLVIIISLGSALAVAGIGTMIGALTYRAGSYKMANTFESVIIQVMALLGGSFFPINILPEFMQKLSYISINGLAMKAYLKVMMGYGINQIWEYILGLIGMGIIFTILAVNILCKEMRCKSAKHNKAKATNVTG